MERLLKASFVKGDRVMSINAACGAKHGVQGTVLKKVSSEGVYLVSWDDRPELAVMTKYSEMELAAGQNLSKDERLASILQACGIVGVSSVIGAYGSSLPIVLVMSERDTSVEGAHIVMGVTNQTPEVAIEILQSFIKQLRSEQSRLEKLKPEVMVS